MTDILKLPSVAEIKKCLSRAQGLLENEFAKNDDECGWYHFLKEGRIGILGTAAGIVTLSKTDVGSPYIAKATVFLKKAQLSSSEASIDGGWSIASIRKIPICESTAWCALALCEVGMGSDSESVGRAVKWLVSNQNPDGGWGVIKPYQSRVYPTSMTIRVLDSTPLAKEYTECTHKAVRWLLNTQNNDGGWGEYPGAASTPIHTAHVILGLLSGGIQSINKSMVNAIGWLYANQDNWNSHFYEAYELGYEETRKPRVRIDHTVLPWVVTALVSADENVNHTALKLAISQIVHSQNPEGFWRSGISERVSIFETQDNVIALSQVLSQAPSLELTLDIQDRLTLLEKEFNKFLPTIIAFSGVLQTVQHTRAFYRKHYWFLTIPLLFSVYSALECLIIRFTNWQDFVLCGLASSTTVAIIAAPTLRTIEKVTYASVVILGGLSIFLFQYSPGETVATVLFAVALSIAFTVYEKYRK